MNIFNDIQEIMFTKQNLRHDENELIDEIKHVFRSTFSNKADIVHLEYKSDELQIYLESHRAYGFDLDDILLFLQNLETPTRCVCIDYKQWGRCDYERGLLLRIKG